MEKHFYSINEFAELLGVHHNTIRNAVKKGRISAFQINEGKNAKYRIPVSEIDRMAVCDLKKRLKDNVSELFDLES